MLLLIELTIVTVLALVLAALYVEEHRTRHEHVPAGTITEYWDSKERRRDIRIPKTLRVRYAIEKKPHLSVSSRTKNISPYFRRIIHGHLPDQRNQSAL